MKRLVLDTNAYTHLLKDSESVLDALDEAEVVYMSVIVLGELYTGFRGGTKYKKNVEILRDFLDDPIVDILSIKEETAEVFGRLKYELKTRGTPLPLNDIWIAAQCIEISAVLVTFDTHFRSIPQVRLWEM